MISSEQINQFMCMPEALIDAMKYLQVKLTPEEELNIFRQRRREIVFVVEESVPGGLFAEEAADTKRIALYDLERANHTLSQFSCIASPATLYTISDFFEHCSKDERILAKVTIEGQNHVEHVRSIDSFGTVEGNTLVFDRQTFEHVVSVRAETDGFSGIIIRRHDL